MLLPERLTELVESFREDMAISFGEGLGDLFNGGEIQNMFQRIGDVMGGFVQALGKMLIKEAIAVETFKKAFAGLLAHPGLAIGVGAGLIALGGVIKNSLKVPQFAQGGMVFGPTMALVGEGRGTSRSNPEVIAPLDKLKQYIGGAAMGAQRVVVEGRLSGKDILLSNARQHRYNNGNA